MFLSINCFFSVKALQITRTLSSYILRNENDYGKKTVMNIKDTYYIFNRKLYTNDGHYCVYTYLTHNKT